MFFIYDPSSGKFQYQELTGVHYQDGVIKNIIANDFNEDEFLDLMITFTYTATNLTYTHVLLYDQTTSIFNTASDITNFNLQTYLINSNNNSLFIQPYYSIIFYNNENILQVIDNSTGSNMLYSLITFNQNLTCTKIIIQYKNKNI